MNFNQTDVVALFSRTPYMMLLRQESTLAYLSKMVLDGEELSDILQAFPGTLYSPLEEHYAALVCRGSASDELISDLCDPQFSWLGIVVACWLVLLSPERRYRDIISSAWHVDPKNQWLFDLAIDEIDGTDRCTSEEEKAIKVHLGLLRKSLSGLTAPARLFRPYPSPEAAGETRDVVLGAYRIGGADAAIKALADLNSLGNKGSS